MKSNLSLVSSSLVLECCFAVVIVGHLFSGGPLAGSSTKGSRTRVLAAFGEDLHFLQLRPWRHADGSLPLAERLSLRGLLPYPADHQMAPVRGYGDDPKRQEAGLNAGLLKIVLFCVSSIPAFLPGCLEEF